MEGIILKALSGFYYVDGGDGVLVACRGRGKFRHQDHPPGGDKVIFTLWIRGGDSR
ncbi:MAG: ribosome-associated GTPase [Flavonifractor plautii]